MKYTAFKPLNYPDGVKSVLTGDRYEGTPIIVYTNGTEQHVYNMEGERLALLSAYKGIDFLKLSASGNWFVYAGVYLKPKKLGAIVLNDAAKFVITDVLVWDGEELLSISIKERQDIYLWKVPQILSPCPAEIYKHIFATGFNGVFKAESK